MTEGAQQTGSDKTAVRPFHVNVPDAELTELRRRINAARWPERETVTDDSQGVPPMPLSLSGIARTEDCPGGITRCIPDSLTRQRSGIESLWIMQNPVIDR
jgi:hypothetical protein